MKDCAENVHQPGRLCNQSHAFEIIFCIHFFRALRVLVFFRISIAKITPRRTRRTRRKKMATFLFWSFENSIFGFVSNSCLGVVLHETRSIFGFRIYPTSYIDKKPQRMKRLRKFDPALDPPEVRARMRHFNDGQILDVCFHYLGLMGLQSFDFLV